MSTGVTKTTPCYFQGSCSCPWLYVEHLPHFALQVLICSVLRSLKGLQAPLFPSGSKVSPPPTLGHVLTLSVEFSCSSYWGHWGYQGCKQEEAMQGAPRVVEGFFGSRAARGVQLQQAVEQCKSLGRQRIPAVVRRAWQRESLAQPIARLSHEIELRTAHSNVNLSSRNVHRHAILYVGLHRLGGGS